MNSQGTGRDLTDSTALNMAIQGPTKLVQPFAKSCHRADQHILSKYGGHGWSRFRVGKQITHLANALLKRRRARILGHDMLLEPVSTDLIQKMSLDWEMVVNVSANKPASAIKRK